MYTYCSTIPGAAPGHSWLPLQAGPGKLSAQHYWRGTVSHLLAEQDKSATAGEKKHEITMHNEVYITCTLFRCRLHPNHTHQIYLSLGRMGHLNLGMDKLLYTSTHTCTCNCTSLSLKHTNQAWLIFFILPASTCIECALSMHMQAEVVSGGQWWSAVVRGTHLMTIHTLTAVQKNLACLWI